MLGEIEVHNRDLEKRVVERTAQLEAVNAELKRSRVVFENLFESLPGLFLVLQPDFKILTASDAYLKATMTRREDLVGRGLFEVFPDNPDEAGATGVSNLRASLERVRKTGEADTMAIQKYDIRRPDGVFEERYWSPVNSPLLGMDRRVEYLIHRVEDVTDFVRQKAGAAGEDSSRLKIKMEQMQAEIFQSSQKVLAINQQLRAANDELEAFSYSVSHDLRAPLRHIDGFAGLLAKSDGPQLSERGRGYLAHISDSARQMSALIDDLLLFSRMGRNEMNIAPVSLKQLAEETIRQQKSEAGERAIKWTLGDLPVVRCDLALLRQVLVNLLSNAVKYTRPRNPAEIEVGCFDETNEVVIFVRDNGVGFEMQYAQKLFGVFQRLHRTEEFEGTGIGLANVRRIVSRHGGRTWAESVPETGATFYFSLPKPRALKT